MFNWLKFGTLQQIDIKNDDTTLAYQEALLLNERYLLAESLRQANQHLDNKAVGLVQVSAIVIGLVSLFSLSDVAGIGGSTLTNLGVSSGVVGLIALFVGVGSFFAFIAMMPLSVKVLKPRVYEMPGSSDWGKAYGLYLDVTREACFQQALSNLLTTIKSLETLNADKSKLVGQLGVLLTVQAVGLMLTVLL